MDFGCIFQKKKAHIVGLSPSVFGWVLAKKMLGKAFAEGVEDGVDASGDLEFPEEAVQMAFYCFLADEEVMGDLFIGVAFGEKTKISSSHIYLLIR